MKHSQIKTVSAKSREIFPVRQIVSKDHPVSSFLIETIARIFSHPVFIFIYFLLQILWILLNLPISPLKTLPDPYPFMFLATFTSVAAPLFTLLILMSERKNSRIGEIREELNLQINLHVEQEVTMLVRLVQELHKGLHIQSVQNESIIDQMSETLNAGELLDHVRQELQINESIPSAGKV